MVVALGAEEEEKELPRHHSRADHQQVAPGEGLQVGSQILFAQLSPVSFAV
jgi:hypothetical protein